ncbi:MAG: glycine--tRNA ligase subunit alpha, partial [Parvularculaceae bacterium]|nr:glycine--tRNA ligase subunit alpha [Parvularculaceae bacterium]
VGGFDCKPVTGEITYGLERLAMYIQGVDNGFDLDFNGEGVTYGDVFHQQEVEFSGYNFELANTDVLLDQFREAEAACLDIIAAGEKAGKSYALPAYDQCIKASHLFNLLDARGVISVAERQSYILRVRTLSKACCEAWLNSPQGRTEGAGVVDYAGA